MRGSPTTCCTWTASRSGLSVLDALTATVTRNLTRCAHLRQSILARAFSGKLVPQDPNDEPADALLARIRSASS